MKEDVADMIRGWCSFSRHRDLYNIRGGNTFESCSCWYCKEPGCW